MKNIAVVCLLVACCAVATHAGSTTDVQFIVNKSWADVLRTARDADKLVFVDAYTDWCGWCKEMDRKTFSNAQVAKLLNERFVSVKIEMETGEGIDLAMKYQVRGFPTFLVVNSNGMVIQRLFGYRPPEKFLEELESILATKPTVSEPGRTGAVSMEWPGFMRAAYQKGKGRTTATNEEVYNWLKKQPDWKQEVPWGVISTFDTPEADAFVVEQRATLSNSYGKQSIRQRLDRVVYRTFAKAVDTKSIDVLEDAIASARSFHEGSGFSSDSLAYVCRYASNTKSWTMLADALRTGVLTDAMSLDAVNEFAWQMVEECSDKAALSTATAAMERSLATGNGGYAEVDTYAALLAKCGRTNEAIREAKRAIDLGNAAGQDVSSTQQLLNTLTANTK